LDGHGTTRGIRRDEKEIGGLRENKVKKIVLIGSDRHALSVIDTILICREYDIYGITDKVELIRKRNTCY